MAIPITVPRLGWNMEQGVFMAWLKKEGETVRPGEPLFELEGDKAVQEVEALDGGILRIPPDAPRPGDTLPVGALLGYLVAPGEAPPWEQEPGKNPSGGRKPPESALRGLTTPAQSKGLLPAISPRARRAAGELGVDWKCLKGSGRTGRIRESDVRAASAKPSSGQIIPITPVRRLIAERMVAGAQTTAPVTLTTRADATNLVHLREQFKASDASPYSVVPSYTDFLLKLTATVLHKHPMLNASWTPDGIRLSEGIHIGIAVDTEAGLMVPVLRDVPALGLRLVAASCRVLIEQARARRLTPEQMQGGTFTITNLGMYGIDAFTPILNLPQCAVLGVGRIHREPAVHNEQIVPRDMLTLSLTFDHRIVDGAPAARFLDTLRQYVEQPGPLLIP
jgi:pyruvate dehydrogenase E2 component (dihydrolipoamide acetyltransferase)